MHAAARAAGEGCAPSGAAPVAAGVACPDVAKAGAALARAALAPPSMLSDELSDEVPGRALPELCPHPPPPS